MFTLIILIFSLFSPSFQTINASFFCEDELKESYIEDPVTKKLTQIGYGPTDGIWSTPSRIPDLAAAPWDTLVFRCYSYKDLDILKGSNYSHSIIYNFKDNNDYLLAYTNHNINILNLTLKAAISSIKINNEIYSFLPWNEKYIIICQGKSFGENQFTKISVVHIDSGKIITDIYISDKKAIKGSIKRLIVNSKVVLVVSDSENKIKLWGIK